MDEVMEAPQDELARVTGRSRLGEGWEETVGLLTLCDPVQSRSTGVKGVHVNGVLQFLRLYH
jgi:hypothetical protein